MNLSLKSIKVFTVVLVMLAFVSCQKEKVRGPANTNKSVSTNDKFELSAASDWTLVNEQGIDTYVGYYQKEDYKIKFDFGRLSFPSIDNIKNSPELLFYEELTIDGYEAKVTKEQLTNGILLSAYIDKDDGINKNRLTTLNTSNDQLFFKIVKSHKFK